MDIKFVGKKPDKTPIITIITVVFFELRIGLDPMPLLLIIPKSKYLG